MPQAIIQLAYRLDIDACSAGEWEAKVFHQSYTNFLVQAKGFEGVVPKVYAWSAMKAAKPKAGLAVPYKIGFPLMPLIDELNNTIPGLTDTLGLRPIQFNNHYFHLEESHIYDITKHSVAIVFSSVSLKLHHAFDDLLLLSVHNNEATENPVTFLVKFTEKLSICRYEEEH